MIRPGKKFMSEFIHEFKKLESGQMSYWIKCITNTYNILTDDLNYLEDLIAERIKLEDERNKKVMTLDEVFTEIPFVLKENVIDYNFDSFGQVLINTGIYIWSDGTFRFKEEI